MTTPPAPPTKPTKAIVAALTATVGAFVAALRDAVPSSTTEWLIDVGVAVGAGLVSFTAVYSTTNKPTQ